MLLSSPLSLWQVEQSLNRRLGAYPKDERMQLFRQAMERMIVVNCTNMESLLAYLFHYVDNRPADQHDFLVIDSIRPLAINAIHQQSDSYAAVNAVKIALREITSVMNESPAAVLITNGISQRNRFDPNRTTGDQYALSELGNVHPSLGPSWALVSHVHVYIYPELIHSDTNDDDFNSSPRASGNVVAAILKSPNMPVGQTCILSQLHA
ncbi:hypothetical protein IWW50_003476 [Coemansia erecta]|nr:hypothetical protein IWW50_003476 [Coemansia erecta]